MKLESQHAEALWFLNKRRKVYHTVSSNISMCNFRAADIEIIEVWRDLDEDF